MLPLLSGLMGVFIAAMAMRLPCQAAVAAILLANWIANTAFCWVTGASDPWMLFIVTDYLSALALLLAGRTRAHYAIAASYALECVMHSAYGSYGNSKQFYWDALYYVAWAQVVFVGAWSVHDWVGRGNRLGSGIPRLIARVFQRSRP
jgi:hypothetical protein